MSKRFVIAAMVAASALFGAAPASAQSYYMREILKGVPKPTAPTPPPVLSNCSLSASTFIYPRDGGLPTSTSYPVTGAADAVAKGKAICAAMSGLNACMVSYPPGSTTASVYPFKEPFDVYSGASYASMTGGPCG